MEETKILFCGDLHKRAIDITTIEGYVKCTAVVQKSIIKEIEERDIDYFISLGDWYDKGYVADVAASLVDYDLDLQMSNVLKGKFFGVIGNHIRLNMDSNPELHLIQPHPYYKSRRKVGRSEQVIKTPNTLRIGDVQISLVHHRVEVDDVLEYKTVREPWAKYHIAVYHTPMIVPNAKLIDVGMGYHSSPNSKISEVLWNVDLAIVGDIHKPLGQFVINTGERNTVMIVPGSLTNTDSGDTNRHTVINAPLLTITKDSEVKLEYVTFDLNTNMLTFKPKTDDNSKAKLKTIRGKARVDVLTEEGSTTSLTEIGSELTSLNAFMKAHGFTDSDKQLVKGVLKNPERIDLLLKTHILGGQNNGL